jgi:hypothetical protein
MTLLPGMSLLELLLSLGCFQFFTCDPQIHLAKYGPHSFPIFLRCGVAATVVTEMAPELGVQVVSLEGLPSSLTCCLAAPGGFGFAQVLV